MTALTLTIDGTAVRQDGQGRYRLNDLHKAAGGELRHKPSEWLRNKQVHELVQEILDFKIKAGFTSLEQIQPLNVIKGGSNPGIFAAKELVYAYAMWISAKFHLAVIHAYDALVSQPSVHQLLADPATLDALAERIAQRLPGTTSPYAFPRPWTAEEDAEADRLRAQGLGHTRIGFALRRTKDSVQCRFALRAKRTAQLPA